MKYTVILTVDQEDGGYVAECPSLPGCVSWGATVEESLRNVKEAIEGCLESRLAHQEPIPLETQVIVATIEAEVPSPVSG